MRDSTGTTLYIVRSPIIGPFVARTNDRLVVTPRHPERKVVVVRNGPDGWYPVMIGQPDYKAIRRLAADGVLARR